MSDVWNTVIFSCSVLSGSVCFLRVMMFVYLPGSVDPVIVFQVITAVGLRSTGHPVLAEES